MTDVTYGAKKSLVFEVEQVVINRMRPVVDGEPGEWVEYETLENACKSAEGGVRRALETKPKLTASMQSNTPDCIHAKVKAAEAQVGEAGERLRVVERETSEAIAEAKGDVQRYQAALRRANEELKKANEK